jgi:hemolysin III
VQKNDPESMLKLANTRKNTHRSNGYRQDVFFQSLPGYEKQYGVGLRLPIAVKHRQQSPAEEIFNSVSHGLGLIFALIGTPYLIIQTVRYENRGFIFGAGIFCVTIIILYFSSAIYHGLSPGKAKRVFRILEHCAIFLLIAGTYTPFTLGALRGPWGWSLFGVVWGLAALGVALKSFYLDSRPILFTSLYLLMGWVAVIAVKPFLDSVPTTGILLLLTGGLFYTVGVVFFATDSRLKYGHFIWHIFVMAGTLCHYFTVLWYAA